MPKARRRIVIDVPPEKRVGRVLLLQADAGASPDEVARIFREWRIQHLHGRRPRRISDKHRALARFTESAPDSDTLAEWNCIHPMWAYLYSVKGRGLSLLRRDWKAAREKLGAV